MQMEDWLTLPQLARELDVSDSTSRRWAAEFSEFLTSRGRGSGRRFHPEARQVLRRVSELFTAGLNTEQAAEALRREFTATTEVSPTAVSEVQPQPDKQLALVPALLAFMQAQEERLQLVQAELATTREKLERMELQAEERDRRLMEAMQQLRAGYEEHRRRPWWRLW